MNPNLKTFPKKYGAQGQAKTYITSEIDTWKRDFEKELQQLKQKQQKAGFPYGSIKIDDILGENQQ